MMMVKNIVLVGLICSDENDDGNRLMRHGARAEAMLARHRHGPGDASFGAAFTSRA
jgi:hypothetical protein